MNRFFRNKRMNKLDNGSSNQRDFPHGFIRKLIQKPFSLLVTITALSLLGISLLQLISGNLYLARLNYVDVTTLAMIGLLLIRAVTKLHTSSDLETISIALVSVLSFIFGYEAIYKWSFYILPWKMPAQELREFLLQVGVGLTILTGFAMQVFKIKRTNQMLIVLFMITWLFWLSAGFPQIWDGEKIHGAVIHIPMSYQMIYTLNRLTKVVWFLFYFFLYV